MTTRTASCRCGQWRAECTGEPFRIPVCHCLDCQQRSGSAFAVQTRFPADRVRMTGERREWVYVSESGNAMSFHFCPTCGSNLWYRAGPFPDAVAIPVGNFADPNFPAPSFSVWEKRKHAWVEITGGAVEHYD